MGRVISFIAGATIGVAMAAITTYLFGPARDTHFDQRYQSRWDRAWEEGRQAAIEHETALRRQLANAKQPGLPLPNKPQAS